ADPGEGEGEGSGQPVDPRAEPPPGRAVLRGEIGWSKAEACEEYDVTADAVGELLAEGRLEPSQFAKAIRGDPKPLHSAGLTGVETALRGVDRLRAEDDLAVFPSLEIEGDGTKSLFHAQSKLTYALHVCWGASGEVRP